MEVRIEDRIVARLRRGEEGELSNAKIEQYALMLAEEVVSPNAAWIICMSRAKGSVPSGVYRSKIHRSPAFRDRVEELMSEKAELETGGVWGRLEWQARQLYRKCAALNDVKGMQSATDTLLRIAMRGDKSKAPVDGGEETGEPRGRGAPPAPTPLENATISRMREKLVSST